MFPYFSDLVNHLFGTNLQLPFYTFGTIFTFAIILAFGVGYVELRRKGREGLIPADSGKLIFSMLNIALIASYTGAKLFHILDHWPLFIRDPQRMLFSLSGHSFFGGIIFGGIALVIYTRKKGIPLPHGFDVAALAILMGSGVGRLACHLSGDGCWGIVNPYPQPSWLSFLPDWTWGLRYPHNVMNMGNAIPGCTGPHCRELCCPVFPTSLYESFMVLTFFLFLWSVRKKISTPGKLFSIFLLLYGLERFFIEFIRVNPKFQIMDIYLSQAQLIALIFIIVGSARLMMPPLKKIFPRHKKNIFLLY